MEINTFLKGFKDYLIKENLLTDTYEKLSNSRLISLFSDELEDYAKTALTEEQFETSIFANGNFKGFSLTDLSKITYDDTSDSFVNNISGSDDILDELDLFAQYMNGLSEDETFFNMLDQDSDGKISEDEYGAFLTALSEYDKDSNKTLEFSELDKAASDIDSGKFSIEEIAPIEEEIQQSELPTLSSAGTAGGGGGSIGGATNSGGSAALSDAEQYSKMDNDELKNCESDYSSNFDEAKEDVENKTAAVDEAQSAYSNIQETQNNLVESAKSNYENIKTDFEKQHAEIAEKVSELLDGIETAQTNVDKAQANVDEKTNLVADKTQAHNDAEAKVSDAELNLSNAQAALASTPETITNEDGESVPNPAYPAAQEAVAQAEAELSAAEEAEEAAKADLENAEEQLELANDNFDTVKAALDTAQENYDTTVKSFDESEQETLKTLTDALKGITNAQTERHTQLQEASQNITTACNDLKTSTETYKNNAAELNKVKQEINKRIDSGSWEKLDLDEINQNKDLAVDNNILKYGGVEIKLNEESIEEGLKNGDEGTYLVEDVYGQQIEVQIGADGNYSVIRNYDTGSVGFTKESSDNETLYTISTSKTNGDGETEENSYSVKTSKNSDNTVNIQYLDKAGNTSLDEKEYKTLQQAKSQDVPDSNGDEIIQTAANFVGMTFEELQQLILGGDNKELNYRFQAEGWCLDFVQFCVDQAIGRENNPLYEYTEHTGWVPGLASWAEKNNLFQVQDTTGIVPGDIGLLYESSDGSWGHAVIIEQINEDGSIDTIERHGNVVERVHRSMDTVGYISISAIQDKAKDGTLLDWDGNLR